jgi:Replication-relaxation
MAPVRTKSSRKGPLVITERMEDILKAVHFYRYMTALDVAYLYFSPKSLTYVGSILASLAGGADNQTNNYLYRFRLPSTSTGNTHRIYTLGSRGREFLARHVGMPVEWYFRPQKVRHFSYGAILHNLILTRFLIAAQVWGRADPRFEIGETRICYEFVHNVEAVKIVVDGRPRMVTVIPDGWFRVDHMKDGQVEGTSPILLEIDRGTAFQKKFKQHIHTRLEFVRAGEYKRLFETEAVTIAYVTTGSTEEFTRTRLAAMCTWASEVLDEINMKNWAPLFRFRALSLDALYKEPLLQTPEWYYPGASKPTTLFER